MDLPELKFSMHAAWAAGFDSHVPIAWIKNGGLIHSLRRGGLEGYIFANPSHVVVAFQGTEAEADDIATDIDARKIYLPGIPGKWHRGFVEGAAKFWPELHSWLAKNLKARKLIITGFSLGAALSQVMSVNLTLFGIPHRVYAFGGPRVATRRAGQWLASRAQHFRVHTYDDPVPHLPPALMGFRHFGHLGVLTADETLVEGPRAWLYGGLFPKQDKRHGHHRLRYLLLIQNL